MLGEERLGQCDQQEVAEDIGLCRGGVFAGLLTETGAAFQMLECNLDPPAQAIEFADGLHRERCGVERGEKHHPFGTIRGHHTDLHAD